MTIFFSSPITFTYTSVQFESSSHTMNLTFHKLLVTWNHETVFTMVLDSDNGNDPDVKCPCHLPLSPL